MKSQIPTLIFLFTLLLGQLSAAQPMDEESAFDRAMRESERVRIRSMIDLLYYTEHLPDEQPTAAEREYWLAKLRQTDLIALESVLSEIRDETWNSWPEVFSAGEYCVMRAEIWAGMPEPPESTYMYMMDNSIPRADPSRMTLERRWLYFEAKNRDAEDHAESRRQRAVTDAHFLLWRLPEMTIGRSAWRFNETDIERLLAIDQSAIPSKRGRILCALERGGAFDDR